MPPKDVLEQRRRRLRRIKKKLEKEEEEEEVDLAYGEDGDNEQDQSFA